MTNEHTATEQTNSAWWLFRFREKHDKRKNYGERFGGVGKNVYFCTPYDESVYYILIPNNLHEKTAIRQ